MLTVEEARARILAQITPRSPLAAEEIPLTTALDRILADDAVAHDETPPFINSAMDGYALRTADTQRATPDTPVSLRLAGEIPAGSVYAGTVAPGETVRILTGAPVPDGADAVLQQELTEVADGWVTSAPAGGRRRQHPSRWRRYTPRHAPDCRRYTAWPGGDRAAGGGGYPPGARDTPPTGCYSRRPATNWRRWARRRALDRFARATRPT